MSVDNRHNGGPELDDELTLDDKEGWIRISRRLRQHYLVGFGRRVTPADEDKDTYSRAEAWMDLIMECRYAAGTVMNGGRKMEIKPGQLVGAVSWLANRWNWTPKTVRGFLDRLEDEGMIERFTPGTEAESGETATNRGSPDENRDGSNLGKQKGKQSSVITISKYEIYQFVRYAEGQAKRLAEGKQGASKGQAEGTQRATYKEEQGNKGTKEQIHTHGAGDEATANETHIGSGVYVSAEQVRHRSFAISVEAVAMQLAQSNQGINTVDARRIAPELAKTHALQWATEINNGKHADSVVPRNIAGAIRSAWVNARNQAAASATKNTPKVTEDERLRKMLGAEGYARWQEKRSEPTNAS